MKRYLLFCFNGDYPLGGWEDFCGDFNFIEECLNNLKFDCFHIVDSETWDIVKEGNS